MNIYNKYWVLFIFLVFAIIIYYNALYVGFISDDFAFFYGIETKSWNSIYDNFSDSFFLPLSHLLQLFLFKIFGENSFIFHLIKIVLHVMIAFQLYLLILQFLDNENKQKYYFFAFITSLIFLILPYQTEAVVWIASNSYVYSLLFGILAIRYYYYKKMPLCWIFILASILCKEMGYIIPFVILTLEWYFNNIKTYRRYFPMMLLIVMINLLLRYIVIGSIIGGYGTDIHLNFSVDIILHYIAYFLKFLTFFRFINGVFFFVFVSFILLIIVYFLSKQNWKIFYKKQLFIIALFLISLLPIINLEITSLYEIESDRYSYFSTVSVSLALGYLIVYLNLKIARNILIVFFVVMFSYLSFIDVGKWKVASEICYTYLTQLSKQDINNKRILLLNVPDTYKGVYVLRNGVVDYLLKNNINCEVQILAYQEFKNNNSGMFVINDSLINNNASTSYISYKNDLYGIDNFNIKDKDLLHFDMVYYYNNKKFYKYYD